MTNGKQITWEAAVSRLRENGEAADLVRDCYFDDPLLSAAERFYLSSEWEAVRRFLEQRGQNRALEVGAGRGIASYALARDGWHVTALEPDPSQLVGTGAIEALFRSAALSVEIVSTWGESLPFPNDSFDLVFCRQVLHHARDLKQLCREIGRVLKPGGMFIACREHVISKPEDLERFLNQHPLHRLYGGENAYLLQEYEDAIQSAGISIAHTLNPFASNINLFPDTVDDLRKKVAARLCWPWPKIIPEAFLNFIGSRLRTPGRLYSFIGKRDAR